MHEEKILKVAERKAGHSQRYMNQSVSDLSNTTLEMEDSGQVSSTFWRNMVLKAKIYTSQFPIKCESRRETFQTGEASKNLPPKDFSKS